MNLSYVCTLAGVWVCARWRFDEALDWLAMPASVFYICARVAVFVRADYLSYENEYLQLKTKLDRQNSFSRVLGTKRATSKEKVNRISFH